MAKRAQPPAVESDRVSDAGEPTRPRAEWRERQRDWLPSGEDRAFVASMMRRVTEPGKVAGWIAPPEIGIDNAPLNYLYVRLN